MAKAGRVRMVVLLALAVITAAVSFYPNSEASISAPAHRRTATQASAAAQATGSEVDAAAPMEGEEEVDPFAPRGWQAPPPPPPEAPQAVVQAAPPPAPVAPPGPPPLPYKFMGTMNGDDDGGQAQQAIYLSKGEQIVVVQGGETLDGTYKVLHVGADSIEFEHLPTGEKQVLNIAANDK